MAIRRAARTHAETTGILDDFRRIVSALREFSRAAESQLGVSSAQLFVLNTLARAPALSINALAAHTHTHQSTVSVVVKRLVAAGLVKRRASKVDGRRLELQVTKAGRMLLQRAPPAVQDRLIQGIDALPSVQRRQLATVLHRLAEGMNAEPGTPSMFFESKADLTRKRPRGRGDR
ncbi:MAG TPA: MarR family transcriptional regulator [Polyangiaceae bacterium]